MCKSVFVCTNILLQCSSYFRTWTKNGKKTTKKTHKWYKNLRFTCTLLYYYEHTNIYWMMNVFLRLSISFLSFSHSVYVYFWLWFYFFSFLPMISYSLHDIWTFTNNTHSIPYLLMCGMFRNFVNSSSHFWTYPQIRCGNSIDAADLFS